MFLITVEKPLRNIWLQRVMRYSVWYLKLLSSSSLRHICQSDGVSRKLTSILFMRRCRSRLYDLYKFMRFMRFYQIGFILYICTLSLLLYSEGKKFLSSIKLGNTPQVKRSPHLSCGLRASRAQQSLNITADVRARRPIKILEKSSVLASKQYVVSFLLF